MTTEITPKATSKVTPEQSAKALERWRKNQEALLNFLEQEAQNNCQAVLAKARQDAQLLLRRTRQAARSQLQKEIQNLRQKRADLEKQLAAHLWQAEQQAVFKYQENLVKQGQVWLDAYLTARWQSARADWLRTLRQQAEKLPKTLSWTIVSASALTTEEQALWPESSVFEVQEDLRAGVQVLAGSVLLDGSLAGLLTDHDAVAARLLRYAFMLEQDHGQR